MTKNEYLIELALALQKIDAGDMLYPEIKRSIAFYQEMIEDMMEEGKSEEEAVAAMEDIADIAERMRREFILPSNGTRTAASEPTREQAQAEPEGSAGNGGSVAGQIASAGHTEGDCTRMKRIFDHDAVTEIFIYDENNAVQIKSGDELSFEYSESGSETYFVEAADGVITARYRCMRQPFWRNWFYGKSSRREFVLTTPSGWCGRVSVKSVNGELSAERLGLAGLSLQTTNARVDVRDVRLAEELKIKTTNARLTLEKLAAQGIDARTSNGRIEAANARISGQCRLGSTNGRINAQDISAEVIGISSSNGKIAVQAINANAIKLTNSNGSICGDICGRMEDYRINAHTSNSKNNLENTDGGDRTLDAVTSNGKIDIRFMD